MWLVTLVWDAGLFSLEPCLCLHGREPGIAEAGTGGAGGQRGERVRLSFADDNRFPIDLLEAVERREPLCWFERIDDGEGIRPGSSRLTVTVERAHMAWTRRFLYAPTARMTVDIPARA